jgi:hypothetical protein
MMILFPSKAIIKTNGFLSIRKKSLKTAPDEVSYLFLKTFSQLLERIVSESRSFHFFISQDNLEVSFARVGCFSFLTALASICRIRSLVTPNSRPPSSKVLCFPSSKPKLNCKTLSSRGESVSKTSSKLIFQKLSGSLFLWF